MQRLSTRYLSDVRCKDIEGVHAAVRREKAGPGEHPHAPVVKLLTCICCDIYKHKKS
jgi:hypothetical protein